MPGVEIYIGELVQHASERAALGCLAELLEKSQTDAVVLANLEIGGRQIDLVVALDSLVLVVEIKHSSNPIRGGANGAWEVRVASGGWKPLRNYYRQTVDALHALRDEMSRFARSAVEYPAAALVFTPAIPRGSAIYKGDHKASVVGLCDVAPLLLQKKSGLWSLADWRRFAAHQRLQRVSSVAAAFDAKLLAAEALIGDYRKMLRRTYDALETGLVSFSCRAGESDVPVEQIIAKGGTGDNLLISGASGCGKTLAACRIACAAIDNGRLPIVLRAKDFDGSLRDVIRQEVTLLGAPSDAEILGAARRLAQPLTLILDGYNECSPHQKQRLTRSVAAAARRYEASIVVTSQIAPEPAGLLDLEAINVDLPGMDTKRAIATQAAGNDLLPALESLLESADSGLEARLIGEIGRETSSDASRYAVFDAFVRKKLGSAAQDAVSALARIAGLLTDRVAFSISVRDLERHAEQHGVPPTLLQALQLANLLAFRGDRASFGHELFQRAFAAEAVVRQATDHEAPILKALAMPRYTEAKALIVGAIDDDTLLSRVLNGIADGGLLEDCQFGQCGAFARAWVERHCRQVINKVRLEVDQVNFTVNEKELNGIAIVEDSLLNWTAQERALLHAIGAGASAGLYLDPLFELAAALDLRLESEFRRLRESAKEKKIALRSGLFTTCYTSMGGKFAFRAISTSLHSGIIGRRHRKITPQTVAAQLARAELTNGQLYTALSLARHTHFDRPVIAKYLPALFRSHWRFAPYHLRLDMLDSAYRCGWAEEEDRKEIIEALKELPDPQNWGLSSILVDALKSLGAMEDEEVQQLAGIKEQIALALADQDSPEMLSLAEGIWFSRFDHPYEGAYNEAFSELAIEDQKAIMLMAAKSTDRQSSWFLPILIIELAAFDDRSVANVIGRFADTPTAQTAFPQGAINVFMTANIALARLLADLPRIDDEGLDAPARALLAAGRILYWLNRPDLPVEARRVACKKPMAVLLRHEDCAAAGALWQIQHSQLGEGLSRLLGDEKVQTEIYEAFPEDVAEICRNALIRPDSQRNFFQYPARWEVLGFCVSCLGRCGSLIDAPLLRAIVDHPELGRAAVDALRLLEPAGGARG